MVEMSGLANLDLYPAKGVFLPGDEVSLILDGNSLTEQAVNLQFFIHSGIKLVHTESQQVLLKKGLFSINLGWQPLSDCPAAYGAEVKLTDFHTGRAVFTSQIQTAFDIQPLWTASPRYGFLSNFEPQRPDIAETLKALTKFHINGLQFYDWQYRHDQLLPPEDLYLDPLGRQLSLKTIHDFISAAHDMNMAAMPYLAVYGASWDFWNEHQDWGLFDNEGKPILFGDHFLGIMNPVDGGKWQQHLLEQGRAVLDALPFDGLHIDQYGDPKIGFDNHGNSIDLPGSFSAFLHQATDWLPGRPLIFNAVGNWPIETLAVSPTAFNYIEIWPPDVHYTDVARIVRNAKKLSNGKPVVIALYLHADCIANNLLADAVIFAAGGSRIELGEKARLLADPYFPKHEGLSKELESSLRDYSDFFVRYQDWLLPDEIETGTMIGSLPEGVVPFLRKVRGGWSLCLVNLADPKVQQWDKPHGEPTAVSNLEVCMNLGERITGIWCVSPDNDLNSAHLHHFTDAETVRVTIPRLHRIELLYIEVEE